MDPNSQFHSEIMPSIYSFIGCFAIVFCSTLSMQVALANLMGYSPLILCGCDLGYPEGKERFTKWEWGQEDLENQGAPFDEKIAVVSGNGILTDRVTLYYKRALYCVWRLDRSQMLSCSEGILNEIPHVEVDDVIDGQGKGLESAYLSEQEIKDRSERYLATKHVYAVTVGNGMRFLEAQDWRANIPNFLGKLIAMGIPGVKQDEVLKRIAEVRGEEL
jgi:hypothetical protein